MAEPGTVEVEVKPVVTEPVPGWPVGVYGAIAAAAGEMKAIEKDQKNQGQNFMFRSIDAIVGHAKPVLANHEISIVPTGASSRYEEVTSSSGSKGWRCIIDKTWRIGHSDGSYIDAGETGEAVDYGDKSTSKASQMAYKYLLTQMLGIGSEDPDSETADVGEVETTEEQIRKRANAVKAALLKEAKGDTAAASSLWDGILEYLSLEEPFKTLDEIEAVEKGASAERPM